MLEQLFGSKTRVNLLRLFLNNPHQPYYLRELARKLKTQLNSIRREVENLEAVGIIKSVQLSIETKNKKDKVKKGSKKYFLTNQDFILFPELKALVLKAQLLLEKNFVGQIEKMIKVKLFILTGTFVGLEGCATDMLLVGTVNHKAISRMVKDLEKELSHSINYTVMSSQEFKYRQDVTDRFLYDILEDRRIVIVDKFNVFS